LKKAFLQILEVRKEKGHHYIAMGNCGQARPNRTTTQVVPVLPIGKPSTDSLCVCGYKTLPVSVATPKVQ